MTARIYKKISIVNNEERIELWHPEGDSIRHWSMTVPAPDIYVMNKEQRVEVPSYIESSCTLRWRLDWLPGGRPQPCLYHPNTHFSRLHAIHSYLHMHHCLFLPA
ncbi:MAG: hypothetical protein EXX96DRAFT_605290 [Benjaminiella poitrasii]|nr:MAG: hypothetical protein EXX96DRAFT_605290 [Benjaminiella poitrasii]